jgi:hypothetical protein
MLHLVDTVAVEPGRVEEYLDVLGAMGMAVMTDAGASFVSCATTSGVIGEPVQLQVVWAVDSHERWNEIRRDLVLDPRYHEYGSAVAAIRTGGTRCFFTPVPLGPPS